MNSYEDKIICYAFGWDSHSYEYSCNIVWLHEQNNNLHRYFHEDQKDDCMHKIIYTLKNELRERERDSKQLTFLYNAMRLDSSKGK